MRVGYLSFFSPWHTETEIADYLEFAGHEVWRYHYTKVNQQKFLQQDFDLVITALPQCLPAEFWKKIKAPKIAWYFDWIRGYAQREQQYLEAVKPFDLTISTDGWIDMYEKAGIPRIWLPHACDPRTYHPLTKTPGVAVGFIGHVYTQERRALLDGLRRRYDFRHYGNREECWGPKYSQVCNSVEIMVGDNCRNDIPGYWSDRLYLSLGSGAFLMYPRVPGIEKYFEDGKHLVLFDNPQDLNNKIDYYLTVPEERVRIARAGAEEVAERHSWTIRIKEFEQILKNIPALAPLLDR
jgi:hypothetical protein